MTVLQHKPDAFLQQVADFAPTIYHFLSTRAGRITTALSSHDVTGGYGHGFTFCLKFEVLIRQCRHCGTMPATSFTSRCLRHSFQARFMQIADAEGQTFEKALRHLEALVSLSQMERMAA